MAARKVSAEFCRGDPAFCSCEKCGDKCPEYSYSFQTARYALNSLEPDSTDDLQVPKKCKSTESVSGKENKPAPNKGRPSLNGKEKARSKYCFSEVTTDKVLAELSKGYIPPNTEKNTGWAMRVFEQWQESRRARGNPVPEIFQKLYDCTALSHWLALFVIEVRKTDGERYPPKSIYQLLCWILRFMRPLLRTAGHV